MCWHLFVRLHPPSTARFAVVCGLAATKSSGRSDRRSDSTPLEAMPFERATLGRPCGAAPNAVIATCECAVRCVRPLQADQPLVWSIRAKEIARAGLRHLLQTVELSKHKQYALGRTSQCSARAQKNAPPLPNDWPRHVRLCQAAASRPEFVIWFAFPLRVRITPLEAILTQVRRTVVWSAACCYPETLPLGGVSDCASPFALCRNGFLRVRWPAARLQGAGEGVCSPFGPERAGEHLRPEEGGPCRLG